MTRQRNRIREYVATHPGQHFTEIVRTLDLAPGQVQYHVDRLQKQGTIVEERLYGRTHYFTPEYDPDDRGAIAVLRRETARDVLVYLLERGPMAPNPVAEDLGIARSSLEWHLDHLIEQNLVAKRRDDRGRVTLVLSRPTDTVRLLEEVSPTLSDRLLDRFTRLVDALLSE